MEKRLEIAVAGILLLVAAAFVIFIDRLVAAPKMLLGRSLTAIEPNLFPLVAMAIMIGLCGLFLISAWRNRKAEPVVSEAKAEDRADWMRVGAFFGILILYALIFYPAGFLISTFVAMALLSVLAGDRNVLHIVPLSILCPIALYIVSTRILLVSLPELSSIEFAYAAVLGR